jgi:hypothetical protein
VYTTRIDRDHPGCILFLVDRSYSMAQPSLDRPDVSLAQGVADAVNNLLLELVLRSISDPTSGPRAYYDVGVIGYGQSAYGDTEAVEPAFAGALAGRPLVSIVDIANHPLRLEARADGDGSSGQTPVWIEPYAGYSTPMCGAIETAGAVLYDWIAQHPTSFPPIVINITDGVVTDDGSDGAGAQEWARRLGSLATEDGYVLLFNLYLSSSASSPVFFPAAAEQVPGEAGVDLFHLSSELPPFMAAMARELGYAAGPGARGLVFNADLSALVSFLRIGTAVVPQLQR